MRVCSPARVSLPCATRRRRCLCHRRTQDLCSSRLSAIDVAASGVTDRRRNASLTLVNAAMVFCHGARSHTSAHATRLATKRGDLLVQPVV
jgi:hypothetical protein